MRAVQTTASGGPGSLGVVELPEPVPAPGWSLLRVSAAGVAPDDLPAADGAGAVGAGEPVVPGREVVGTTADGRRVVALVDGGGYAEVVAAGPGRVFEVPDGVADDQALALLTAGSTAWHLLRTCADLQPGECVVVHDAPAGVGSIALQLARRWGAGRVVATAPGQQGRDLALALGADAVVDLSGLDAAAAAAALREAAGGEGADVVLDGAGGGADAPLGALTPFGRLVLHGTPAGQGARRAAVDPAALVAGCQAVVGFTLAQVHSRRHGLGPALEELLSLTAMGLLAPVVGGHHPLADAAAAHARLADGATGKLVLDVA